MTASRQQGLTNASAVSSGGGIAVNATVLEEMMDFVTPHHGLAVHHRVRDLCQIHRARQALLHARRSESGAALLWIDLDGFKAVNDRLGHAAETLTQCADVAMYAAKNSGRKQVRLAIGG